MKPALVWLVLSPIVRWQSWADAICCLGHTLCHKCVHLGCELMMITRAQGSPDLILAVNAMIWGGI